MRVGNRVVFLTVGMVVLAGVLSAGAAMWHTRNLSDSYDEAIKTQLEEKALAYGGSASVFLDALGLEGLTALRSIIDFGSDVPSTADGEGADSWFMNEIQSFQAWLPDSSVPGGFRLIESLDFFESDGLAPSEEIVLSVLEKMEHTDAARPAAAAIDEEAELILTAFPIPLDDQAFLLAVAALSAEEEFAFVRAQRRAAIRNGIALSATIVAFVSLVGGGLSYLVSRDLTNRQRAEEAIREQADFLESTLNALSHPFYVIDAKDYTIEMANTAARSGESSGAETCYALSHRLSEPCSSDQHTCPLEEVKKTKAPATVEHIHYDKDGNARTYEVHSHPIFDSEGNVKQVIEYNQDVTERKRAEEALRQRTHDLGERVKELGCLYGISALVEKPGTSLGEILQGAADLIPPGWQYPEITCVRVTLDGQGYRTENFRETDWRQASDIVVSGNPAGCVEVYYLEERPESDEGPFLEEERSLVAAIAQRLGEATERKQAEGALREQARRDPLTGALNHGAIMEELRQLLSDGGDGASHSVALIDVDGLKATNDTYGHQVGDQVLVAIAGTLSRDGTIVGRYGGDEFIAIMPGAERQAAERYRDAVFDELAGASLRDPETTVAVPIAASVGLAIYPAEAGTVHNLIRLADDAMYNSRRQRPVGAAGQSPATPLRGDRAAEMVGEIVPLLTSEGGLDDKLKLVAYHISAGAGHDAVNFDVFSRPGGLPSARNVYAEVPNEVIESWRAEGRRMDEDPFVQLLLRTRHGIILNDPQNDKRVTKTQRSVLRAAELRSAAVVPLFWKDDLIGVLSAASKREGAFTPRDVEFLTAVATQVTAIVRMASLVDELQSASDRLAQAQGETMMLLADAAEAHDRTTGLHLQSVRVLTEAVARELGYDEDAAQELGLAAVLHDIGKIRVPDSILTSTARLADEEWKVMQQHAAWGGSFLAERPGFALAATIARSHHEWWDGTGYPDGLAGEAIPEAATIVSVADSFDAMIHERPYKARLSIDEAVREVIACSGKQFSPRVAAAFERLHQRGELSLPGMDDLHQRAAA